MSGRRRDVAPEDADEDEDELLEWDVPSGKDTVLWLIDAGTKMHDTLMTIKGGSGVNATASDGSEEAPKTHTVSLFHRAMQAAYHFERRKLVESPADQCGILLFNTRDDKFQNFSKTVAYPHKILAQPLAQVAVPPVSELKDDLQDSLDNGPSFFREKYAPNDTQTRIHHALTNAETVILAAGKTGTKRIFYVTCEDDPMADKKGRMEQNRIAFEKVRSMSRRGIEFEPFLISSDEHEFDVSRFYGHIFSSYINAEGDGVTPSAGDEEEGAAIRSPWNATTKFDDLEQDIGARETPLRTVFDIPMFILPEADGGLTMGVKGYCTIKRANKGVPVKVIAMPKEDEDDPTIFKEVAVDVQLRDPDSKRVLDPEKDIETVINFGSDSSARARVRFTRAELKRLRFFGQKPSIRVLGFKSRDNLRFYENVKHSYFIYPTDAEWKNSKRCFAAFLDSMARKDKMMLAVFTPRQGVVPCFAYILPAPEVVGDEGQMEPPGMYVVPLPYADDLREAPDKHRGDNILKATPEQVEAAGKVIRCYTRNRPFNPDHFPNPALDHHYKTLLAVAFDEDVPRAIIDKTMPDYAQIKERCGELIATWNELIENDERVAERMAVMTATSTKKRPQTFATEDEPELKRLHLHGNLAKLVVDKLKAACDYYRLPKDGKKADLVMRLEEHLEKKTIKNSEPLSP